MKKLIFTSVMFFLLTSFFTVSAIKTEKKTESTISSSSKVEVYYFHFTRRCATCKAVETETQKALEALYPSQFKSGKISFKSVNMDDKGNKALVDKCKVEGQALLVTSGNKRVDLIDAGFMYARTNPEKLKTELKKAIDPLITK